jgi:putative PEP-CTERM system TPR-repeat lipoprotein
LAGATEYSLQSYALAESHLSKVLQRAPEHTVSRRLLILTYLRMGETEKALKVLKPVLGKIDKDPSMLAVAGEAYMMHGDHTQAAHYFGKAAALDPADNLKRTAVAVNLVAKGDTERGLRELEQIAADDTGIRADLALIATHMQRRAYDTALKAIASLEKKQPTNPAIHNLRGGVLLAKNDAAGARRSFERALELSPGFFPAVAMLARLDVADKKPDAAKQRLDAVLAKDPRHRDALLALAGLRSTGGSGAAAEVVGLLNRAISAHPNDPVPRIALVSYHLRTRDAKKAVTAAQEALFAIPNHLEIMEAAGRAYAAGGDANQALAVYMKLASLQPSSPQPYLRMAELHLATKNKEAASVDLRKALSLQPDYLDAQRAVIALAVQDGRVQEALATAKEVQKQRPKQAIGYLYEGDIHAGSKQWQEAAAAYRRGLKENPSVQLAIRLHDLLITSGNKAGADQFAAAWFKERPKEQPLRLHLAQRAMVQNDFEAATQHYRKLLDNQPNNVALLNNLAWVSSRIKDPKAIAYAEHANKLAPEQPVIMDTLGTLLVEQGDTERGLELLRKASALAPQAADIRLNLAKGQLKAGQKDAAKKELDELSKLGEKFPRHAEVKQLKQGL